jgi:hypothetical protein
MFCTSHFQVRDADGEGGVHLAGQQGGGRLGRDHRRRCLACRGRKRDAGRLQRQLRLFRQKHDVGRLQGGGGSAAGDRAGAGIHLQPCGPQIELCAERCVDAGLQRQVDSGKPGEMRGESGQCGR